ncbi:hypothetical protein AUC68_05660 [Methyloceanibacter methanicus]|uniref:Uncharacterized protein n=1 Tax=Methyloceanibacter methanicus TaxID=1774968 RepID=A0A1E3W0Z0_9HYPH|nr:hypothetical protein [Methyloceanibacter methanicus]ODR99452.1 hypothetical protein AUC68_05660 [Methyloceanibacter methanicus]
MVYVDRSKCVVLPNGYMIGQVSFFHENMYRSPSMTLRRPDGTVLVRELRAVEFFVDPQTPLGVIMVFDGGSMKMPGQEIMFALLGDEALTGGWYRHRTQDRADKHIIHTDLSYLMVSLRRSRPRSTVSCGTPWFDWGE